MLGGTLSASGRVRVIWWLLLAFISVTMAAQALLQWQTKNGGATFPAWSDWVFLISYLPAFAALAILIHRLHPGNDRETWIDATILTVAAACVFIMFLVAPALAAHEFTAVQVALAIAYPLLDLILLSALIWLLVGTGRPPLALALLTFAFCLVLAADVVRDADLVEHSSSAVTSWTGVVRLAALFIMAAAATTPSASEIATPDSRGTTGATTARLSVLAVGVLTVPTLIVVRLWNSGDTATQLLALSALAIIILAVWRLQMLVTALERQRRLTELVLDSTGEGIVGVDRKGHVLFANLASRRMLRTREADLIGRRFHDIAHHETADGRSLSFEDCPVTALIQNGEEGYVTDQVLMSRGGSHLPVEIFVAPLVTDGQVVGAVQSFRDVSERLAVEQLQQQFVSVVSHELRTPLTSIKGSLQMLDSGVLGELTQDQQELVTMAVANSNRLSALVDDILDIERLSSGRLPLEPELVSVHSLLAQAGAGIRGAADAAGISVEIEQNYTGDCDVYVDPHRIHQVLMNLMGNAIKFSDRGTTVQLRSTTLSDEVRLVVADEGRGIPDDQLEHIFERFGQVEAGDARRGSGTGLGLAISREIVTRSGGRIEVVSTVGEGSEFSVILPRAQEGQEAGES
jgi:PAS domain S-box-containing protein